MDPVFSPEELIVSDGVDEERVEKLRGDLNKLLEESKLHARTERLESNRFPIKIPLTLVAKLTLRRLLANGFSKASRSASNLPWSINSLPEEYRAHFLDQRNAMLEAGEAEHIIQRKLFQYWFMAVIWTPIVSKLQSLIPPNRISS